MRAGIVSEYGGSPHVEDLASPEAQSGQVLIKVLAAGMNWRACRPGSTLRSRQPCLRRA